ncbi:uncharacterized protein [Pseudochaenichthys georgianus]|uniref:uncharacterized protein isoform X1 n=1 Tax=Pseudochaenichthys georgianus TaxID=52239 RepID=UPI0039C3B9EE
MLSFGRKATRWLLSMVEYAHNSLVCSATGMSPFTASNLPFSRFKRERWQFPQYRGIFGEPAESGVKPVQLLPAPPPGTRGWRIVINDQLRITNRARRFGFPPVTSLFKRILGNSLPGLVCDRGAWLVTPGCR